MKSILNIVLFLFISTLGFSQFAMNVSENSMEEVNYNTPEISQSKKLKIAKRQNKSTIKQLKSYLSKQLKYSEIMVENGIEGQVIVQVDIATDGSINSYKVINSPHTEASTAILKTLEGLKKINIKEDTYYGYKKIRIPVNLSLR